MSTTEKQKDDQTRFVEDASNAQIHEENKNLPDVDAVQQDRDLIKSATVDTLHDDEAVAVVAPYDGDREWDEKEEKRLLRKIDMRVMTILFITYGLQFYDKAMLGQAV